MLMLYWISMLTSAWVVCLPGWCRVLSVTFCRGKGREGKDDVPVFDVITGASVLGTDPCILLTLDQDGARSPVVSSMTSALQAHYVVMLNLLVG